LQQANFVLLAAALSANNSPFHSSSPNVAISFLQQLGWIMFLHAATSHFFRFSSALDISSAVSGMVHLGFGYEKRGYLECPMIIHFVNCFLEG